LQGTTKSSSKNENKEMASIELKKPMASTHNHQLNSAKFTITNHQLQNLHLSEATYKQKHLTLT
jgi:hypothetical protein